MISSAKTLLAAGLLVMAPAHAADIYELDPAHTQTIFTIDHLGFSTITGSVRDLKGTLILDTAAPEKSTVDVTMAADSVDTGFAARNQALQGPMFFNIAQFPAMTFKSTHIRKTGDTTGTDVDKVGFTATTTIKRSDFGMKAYVPSVGDEVQVTINFEGIKQEGVQADDPRYDRYQR